MSTETNTTADRIAKMRSQNPSVTGFLEALAERPDGNLPLPSSGDNIVHELSEEEIQIRDRENAILATHPNVPRYARTFAARDQKEAAQTHPLIPVFEEFIGPIPPADTLQ